MKNINLFKKLLPLMLLIAAPAMADLQLSLNGQAKALASCGGTIRATSSSNNGVSNGQLNIIIHGSEECSNFLIKSTGKDYKLQGHEGNYGGSYTIAAGALHPGLNYIWLVVQSNSGKHLDDVGIEVEVDSASQDNNRCSAEAAEDASEKTGVYYGTYAEFNRVSNKGNLVYDAYSAGEHFQVVLGTDCSLKNIQGQ